MHGPKIRHSRQGYKNLDRHGFIISPYNPQPANNKPFCPALTKNALILKTNQIFIKSHVKNNLRYIILSKSNKLNISSGVDSMFNDIFSVCARILEIYMDYLYLGVE